MENQSTQSDNVLFNRYPLNFPTETLSQYPFPDFILQIQSDVCQISIFVLCIGTKDDLASQPSLFNPGLFTKCSKKSHKIRLANWDSFTLGVNEGEGENEIFLLLLRKRNLLTTFAVCTIVQLR